jgi:hypothetical protein
MPVSLYLSGKYRDMTPSRYEGKYMTMRGILSQDLRERAMLILKVLGDRFCNKRKIIQPAEPMNFKER